MSKYKTGDKVVLEIIQDDSYGDYKVGNETHSWWNSHELLDNGSVPLSKYIKSMEEKLHNQRVEINRLIEENKELKINANWHDNCAKVDSIDKARTAGQQEAWELARKCMLMTDREREAIFGSGYNALYGVLTYFDYKHAAAKVAEWERKKEEICVGDMLLSNGTSNKCVVTYIGCELITMLWDDGSCSNKPKNFIRERFKKIGHIDVASMLAQIGGEE